MTGPSSGPPNGAGAAAPRATGRSRRDPELLAEVTAFLHDESAALDEHRPRDWLGMLAEDFEYLVPLVEIYEDPDRSPYHPTAFLDQESRGSLELKLLRAESEYAWAQRPSGFLRHFVTNVRLLDRPDGGPGAGDEQGTAGGTGAEVAVASNVLVTWTRDPEPPMQLSAGRVDRLRRGPEGLLLARRTVHLDTAYPHSAQAWVVY